jgi:hypothetical protein
LVNRASTIHEPALKLSWLDGNQRSIFFGSFGPVPAGKDVICGEGLTLASR